LQAADRAELGRHGQKIRTGSRIPGNGIAGDRDDGISGCC
jgi:hypothetical protein